ncbi:MAG: hypothetical protein U9N80_03155 [Chloroflexota bacterium]|nr:hypothetical protein [Chloroflexota bacterium]
MRVLHTQQDWFDRLLPDGLPISSSTLLSGPGGSGKPLVGNVIAERKHDNNQTQGLSEAIDRYLKGA